MIKMKEFKGTKESWKVDIDHQTHLNNKVTICIGNLNTGLDWEPIAETNGSDKDLNIHNAQLISAAPDLLEALQGFIDPLTGMVFDHLARQIGNECAAEIERAISKALGIDHISNKG